MERMYIIGDIFLRLINTAVASLVFLCVATTNGIGNSVATVVTAKLCGEFDPQQNRQAMALHDAGKSPVPTL